MTVETGAEAIARVLRLQGIDAVFALCGDHINQLFMAMDRAGIHIIDVRHEAAGVQMADGYARATGRPAVFVATGGPGHANALTGLQVAMSAATPVVLISGQTPVAQWETGGQQILRQGDMARPVAKWAVDAVAPVDLGNLIARALAVAAAPRPGPVSLSIAPPLLDAPHAGPVAQPQLKVQTPHTVAVSGLEDAALALCSAERPVVVAGSGAMDAPDASAAALLALNAPVFTIDQARGLLPDDEGPCLGYADPLFNPAFRRIVEADVLCLAGAAADFHLCFARPHLLAADTTLIQISDSPHHLGMNRVPDHLFHGPVGPMLSALVTLTETLTVPSWLGTLRQMRRSALTGLWETPSGEGDAIHPMDLMRALLPHQTAKTAICVDVGDFIHWPRCALPARVRRGFHDGVLSGNLGSGIPLGLGVQQASPGRPVWVFCGDGGFRFHMSELETAVAHHLPVKVIVGNDSAWGVEQRLQTNAYGRDVGCLLPPLRLDDLARSFGAGGFRADTRDDLEVVLPAFLAHDGPAVLDVTIPQLCGRPFADFKR
ncbi:MAG: thiamine pyrophosphate-binding protein [Pseudomonadota bacterium]